MGAPAGCQTVVTGYLLGLLCGPLSSTHQQSGERDLADIIARIQQAAGRDDQTYGLDDALGPRWLPLSAARHHALAGLSSWPANLLIMTGPAWASARLQQKASTRPAVRILQHTVPVVLKGLTMQQGIRALHAFDLAGPSPWSIRSSSAARHTCEHAARPG